MASITIIDNGTAIKRYKVYYDVDYGDNKRHRKSKTFPAGTPKSIVMDFKQKVEIEYRLGTLGILESKVTMDELIQSSFVLLRHLSYQRQPDTDSIEYRSEQLRVEVSELSPYLSLSFTKRERIKVYDIRPFGKIGLSDDITDTVYNNFAL